jgi:hypothetical protein
VSRVDLSPRYQFFEELEACVTGKYSAVDGTQKILANAILKYTDVSQAGPRSRPYDVDGELGGFLRVGLAGFSVRVWFLRWYS